VPGTEWRSSTLHIPAARDSDLELGGRGLVLYPCVGWTGHVLSGDSPDGARCLFYPAITPLPLVDVSDGGDPIAELLGLTRAAVLQAAVEPHSTGELARDLGISAASVSAHTKTLRAAGLLTSERDGKAVFHSASPLGHRLLTRHLKAVAGLAPVKRNRFIRLAGKASESDQAAAETRKRLTALRAGASRKGWLPFLRGQPSGSSAGPT
jgi:DNA-binding transcriptional ArsR family regulator